MLSPPDYPTISLGLKYSANVTLHRGAESGIATDQMASYDSDIGEFRFTL